MSFLKSWINGIFEQKEPWQVVRDTAALLVVLRYTSKAAKHLRAKGVKATVGNVLFSVSKHIPAVGNVMDKEKDKAFQKIEEMMMKDVSEEKVFEAIPRDGVPKDQLLTTLQRWSEIEHKRWNTGRMSGGVYHGEPELLQFITQVYGLFAVSNPLHAEVFPFVRKMEAEVVTDCCGVFTSGGTESILMAVKAYRDWGRAEKGITEPEIVVATTVHAAFDKAGHYFGVTIVKVPTTEDFVIDVNAARRAITRNTIAVVGSAPCFSQGTIDPIEQLSALALEHDIGLHVDCCLGGLLLPFVAKLGFPVPAFDFQCPGVTSISADTHKYGYAPKGSSVLLYRSKSLRRHQYFVTTDWTGGIYATPTTAGSRPGALVAGTWAALVSMGERGYLQCAEATMTAAKAIEKGIAEIDGLRVLGHPVMSVIAFGADPNSEVGRKLDIFKVADAMSARKWNLNRLQHPASMHIACTYVHRNVAPSLLADLAASVREVIDFPANFKDGNAVLYGMSEALPGNSLVTDIATGFLDALYITRVSEPAAAAASVSSASGSGSH